MGSKCPFKAAVCIAGPYNVDLVTKVLLNDDSMIYNDSMVRGVLRIIEDNYSFLLKTE